MMARVLITEKIADAGIERLREAGHDVDVKLNLSEEALLAEVRDADAVIIRSATTITKEVIKNGEKLLVIGRAGIGLDNVDVNAATEQGVMVVNAPKSNILSAAEHTIALILAQARNIPQANSALKSGRWERNEWTGVELADKTLGIIGLGRIGKLVAQRALAFGMNLVAYDPFVANERARQLSVQLMPLEELIQVSDFLTIHVAKTPETENLINAELLSLAKPSLRIINVARGGIVNEVDLAEAVTAGKIAGAAIDVFENEPVTESPLFSLPQIVVTPHLGASTTEAQDKAGESIAEQVELALLGDFVPHAVNVAATEAAETVRPFLPLAEQLGAIFSGLLNELPEIVEIEFAGEIGGYDNKITELSAVKGLLAGIVDQPISYVNAIGVAKDHGVQIRSTTTTSSADYVNTVTIRGGGHAIAGTLVGLKGEARIVMVDDHTVDMPPSTHMVILRNDDRPGVIGKVGTILGEEKINIVDMNVGRSKDGLGALMVISTQDEVPNDIAELLMQTDGVTRCSVLNL
ncbi:MAG TPA: phosphoglycerate dehydrogenase [Acidimicrobiaceae bacterium]|jgi:D-3-phosphoglycerate dehydrogenase|nr:phosphoglycerate dehydrogenase [Acidimicrobiaceae bacterium]|tara:strand:+ start:9087 stop:10655 length:1569 start_codon:yes stop_codon:yes gene_type:complete